MKTYEFREVLEHAGITRSQLARWTDAGILQPAGGGGKGQRREYTLHQVVEAVVCDRLHRLGASEVAMRAAVAAMNYISGLAGAVRVGRTILWLRLTARDVRRYDARIDADLELRQMTASGPMISVETHLKVQYDLSKGVFGIAIPLLDIIADVERSTGEKLS